MKSFLTLMILMGIAIPWACSKNNNPISPVLTATPVPTATNWANYTATNTPTFTPTLTATATNITATFTPSATITNTTNPSFTFTVTYTFSATPSNTPTPTGTPTVYNGANSTDTPAYITTGPSVIQYPNGLASGSNGNIYVVQGDGTSNGNVQILNSSLTSLGSINSYGVTDFGNPSGVATNAAGTTIYVVDSVNNAVYELTSGGATVTSWSSYNSTSFANPEGIAIDSLGNIYVADTYNNEVEEFTSSGTPETEWTGGTMAFSNPSAVALDGANNLYVADSANQLVQILNGGTWTSWSTNIPALNSPPDVYSDVYGIAVAGSGSSANIYVADSGYALVEEYSYGGSLETAWNGQNSDFISPDGVIILPGGNILVTDFQGPDPPETGSLQEFGP